MTEKLSVKGKQGKNGGNPSQQPLRLQSDCLPYVKDCFSGNRRKAAFYYVIFNARVFGRFFKEMFMKKLVAFLLLVVALFSAVFVACNKTPVKVLTDEDEFVVLVPSSDYAGSKFIDYMNALANESDEFTFVADNSFIQSINGTENSYSTNYYWMLYTNDADNSSPAWLIIKYNGAKFYASSYGVNDLEIVEGKTYIWVYLYISA